jgi:hypothetical protein
MPLLLASNGNGATPSGPSVRIPGAYASMLRRCKAQHEMIDPRATVGQNLSAEQLAALQDQRRWTKPSGRYAALLAGESVTVPAWFALPGHEFRGVRQEIPWLESGGVVQVGSDDVVRPGNPLDVMAGRT